MVGSSVPRFSPNILGAGRLPGLEQFEEYFRRDYTGSRNSASGAQVEVLLVQPMSEDEKTWPPWFIQVRRCACASGVAFDGVEAEVNWTRRVRRADVAISLRSRRCVSYWRKSADVPLPPYIKRTDTAEDRERYQTVFAREEGIGGRADGGLAFHRRDFGCMPEGRGGDCAM